MAWRFRAMPASNSASPATVGLSEGGVEEGGVGVEGALTNDLLGLESPRVREVGL